MKMNIIMVVSIFLPIFSFLSKPKLCINCKNFIKERVDQDDKYGKCKAFFTIKENDEELITGNKKDKEIDYYYCSNARKFWFLCGKIARKYQEK